jgi:EAL domain-containing protein (putative c-di-GMP-specific phosphodiesterase class I)
LSSVALIALAGAHLMWLLRSYLQSSEAKRVAENQADLTTSVISLASENRRMTAEAHGLAQTVDQVRQETSTLHAGLTEGITSLRLAHEQVAQNLQSILETQRDIQSGMIQRNAQQEASQAALQAAMSREQDWMAHVGGQTAPEVHFEEQQTQTASESEVTFEDSDLAQALTLALEPVVDLFTSSTAHYRMVLGMVNEQGFDVAQDVFLHHAGRIGLRDQLDQHVVEQTLALLGPLRQRDPALAIFVPLGSATLSNPQAIANIQDMLVSNPGVANGLVIDIAHAVLASLPEASLEGLATLARGNVQLSLSQASISGIDLAALNRLNVRFVSLAASSVGVGAQVSAGLAGFIQSARALRIQVIISNVGDPRHVQGLARTARYATGPAFALPRKLKRTAPETHAQANAA